MSVRGDNSARPLWDRDQFVQQALLAAVVESSDDAIVSKTLDGRILSWNSGATRIFGYQPEEIIGRPITTIIPPELHDEERTILEKLRRGERIDHFDTTRITKDGRRIPISLTVSPIRDANGRIVGASKVARDISERKRAEMLMRKSEAALIEADRRKDEFLALLAHELRNFVAPIGYAVAALKSPTCTEQQWRHSRDVIERQLGTLRRLLDDLLDASRIGQGKLELKIVPTDLHTVLEHAVETARPVIDAKQQVLSRDVPPHPVTLAADPHRLTQVFSNLLINAAKYTNEHGHIGLRAHAQGKELVVSVTDNGMGIAADVLPRIFALFSQGPALNDCSQGGLGIGLALVRGIVKAHNGTVEARSEGLNRGSEFIVRLPLPPL